MLLFLCGKTIQDRIFAKKQDHKTDYNRFIEEDSVVMDELEAIRVEHAADRAIVLELRNGEVNLADIPSMKIHVRNERLRPRTFGLSSIANGIPASFYSTALKTMVKGERFILPDVSELENIDFGLYHHLIASNVKSLYAFPLFDSKDTFYGCLMLQYCNNNTTLLEAELHEVERDAARINGEVLVMKKAEDHSK